MQNRKSKRQSRKLTSQYLEHDMLTEDIIREVWSLRLELLKLRKSKEDDWAYFREMVSRPDSGLILARDNENVLQGFYSMAYFPIDHEGRKALLVYSKYLYFRKAYRGNSVLITSGIQLLPYMVKKYGFRMLYLTISAYQQSYTFFNRTMGMSWALQDQNMPVWERYVLAQFAESIFGEDWDKDKQLIANQSVPSLNVSHLSGEILQLHKAYEALNPEWGDGYSMFIMAPLNLRAIMRAMRLATQRLHRRIFGTQNVSAMSRSEEQTDA